MAATAPDFAKMVPGFDFLQGLVKNAGSVLPNIGQWVAPTLNPEELEKRINELRTVQFWLEQNARMLGATIQALEVQRMTLSTLKTMNVQVTDLREAMKIKMPEPSPGQEPAPAEKKSAFEEKASGAKPARASAAAASGANVVDPMQWWGALTKQFTQLAANAMKDAASESAPNLASSFVKQSFDAAQETMKAGMATAKKAAAATAAVGAAAGKSGTGKAGNHVARKAAPRKRATTGRQR